MGQTHELKILPVYFKDVKLGIKKFEIRLNDRNFKERDILILKESKPEAKEYKGNQIMKRINEVYANHPGLLPNYVILQQRSRTSKRNTDLIKTSYKDMRTTCRTVRLWISGLI